MRAAITVALFAALLVGCAGQPPPAADGPLTVDFVGGNVASVLAIGAAV